jgi:tetratricopeptide (TPR) repeat protein
MRNLANTYYLMGRHDEALKLWQEVLPLRRKVNGPENPETLWAMEGLALCLFQADRLDEALKLQEEVLTNRIKVLGPEHRATMQAMHNLANSYRRVGRPEEALNLLNRALALQRKVVGPQRFDTLNTMNSIALILATSDDPKLRNGTNAVSLAEAAVTGTHRRTFAFLNTLAAAYAEAGQFDKAVAAQQEAISLARNEKEKKDLESALKLYQSNKPMREHWEP